MKGRLVTHQPQVSAGFPILGTIRVGQKVDIGDGRSRPSSLDHFICNDKYGRYFHEAYGDQPDSIEIAFVSDDPEISCNHRLEYRDKNGKLFASGDGRTFKVWTGNQYETFTTVDYPDIMETVAEKESSQNDKGWEHVLTLQFLLLRVRSVGGLWRFVTRGKASTIPNIVDTYDNFMASVGTVTKTPFDLVVKKVTSQKPGSKNKYPVVELIPNIGAEHQEKLAQLVDSGFNVREFRGLLSEGAIEQLSTKPLLGQTTEGYAEVVEPITEKQKADLLKARPYLSKSDLNDVVVNMDSMTSERAEQILERARQKYKETSHENIQKGEAGRPKE